MASSSEEEGSVPFDKFAAASRVSELVRFIMKNKASPKALAAARAEAMSLSEALGRNAARMEQENSCTEKALDGALAAGKAFFADRAPAPVPEKPEKKNKKYRRVKLSEADIKSILSYKSSPLTHLPATFVTDEEFILDWYPVPKEQVLDYFTLLFSAFDGADDDFMEMQKRVREDYQKKGYAHHWVTDDEDEAPPPRPAARRRARPGVMKHNGETKKLN